MWNQSFDTTYYKFPLISYGNEFHNFPEDIKRDSFIILIVASRNRKSENLSRQDEFVSKCVYIYLMHSRTYLLNCQDCL